MNKTTLIIDGNWLLMSRVSVMLSDFDISYSDDVLDHSRDVLIDLMAQSVHKIVSTLTLNDNNIIDNVIMVQDGGSWRKTLPLPVLYQEDAYKGQRTKSEDVNWSYIWQAHDDFFTKCKEQGMAVFKAFSIEGDDWCWYWTDKLGKQGINTIVWSTDADLKQLVKFHESSAWTAWFNERNGLCYPKRVLSELDMFMLDINSQDFQLENAISSLSNMSYLVTEIQGEDVVMYKNICGDVSDNIKPVLRLKQGTRTIKVSEKEWLTVKESLNIHTLNDFYTNQDDIIMKLKTLKRFKNNIDSFEDLKEVFEYNKRMVYLHESSYPNEILEGFDEQKDMYCVFPLEDFKNNYNILSTLKLTDEMELFDGVEW